MRQFILKCKNSYGMTHTSEITATGVEAALKKWILSNTSGLSPIARKAAKQQGGGTVSFYIEDLGPIKTEIN